MGRKNRQELLSEHAQESKFRFRDPYQLRQRRLRRRAITWRELMKRIYEADKWVEAHLPRYAPDDRTTATGTPDDTSALSGWLPPHTDLHDLRVVFSG